MTDVYDEAEDIKELEAIAEQVIKANKEVFQRLSEM